MEKRAGKEGAVLVFLSCMLVCVFLLSVWMYDGLAASAEEGALAVLASHVRTFIDENAAVAVFFGLEEESETADICVAAKEYIERYNSIYAALE